ncbi:hypothetical protein [Streptomyces beihaiensis]|uniref:DUF3592 domain-containing protein n=1 Tax=Streptomyces beihaiensis TaxID=2984495 RepID=A0ABT3TXW0_9ACTN|nr:hypothetical protein [Streptomyces beihaiensis]MCX3061878.1 hypothetical protein [Streptomyces beihaiensis]
MLLVTLLVVYLLPLLFVMMGALGIAGRVRLRKRGVRVRAHEGGDSWTGGIQSMRFVYKDAEGRRHRLVVSPGDVPDIDQDSIMVVYDPRRPGRAISVYELQRSFWRTTDGVFGLVGIIAAVALTVYLIW